MAKYISNLSNLIKLGWVDSSGNEVSWKFYNRQPRKYYYVLEEIDEEEWKAIQLEKEKKRKEREMFGRNESRFSSSLANSY